MKPYGAARTKTMVPGHQRCGICHPHDVRKKRARRVPVLALLAEVEEQRLEERIEAAEREFSSQHPCPPGCPECRW